MPLCIDLFCGLGGWTDGFLAEGWDVIGFDNHRHEYGNQRYPAQLVIQDVLTLHGSQLKRADCIVASPPCQKYSWMAMPWGRSKREVRWQEWERDSLFGDRLENLNALFSAGFRIQREASEAAGHHIPMVVENVKGAQRWVGRAAWHHGSFFLWGDVPVIMPAAVESLKVPGISFNGYGTPGYVAQGFNTTAAQRLRDLEALRDVEGGMKGKAASAMIAKIPPGLSQYIARYYDPRAVLKASSTSARP